MMRAFRILLLVPLSIAAAYAQVQVHFGVTAGVPLTDTLSSYSNSSVTGADSSLFQVHSVTKRLLIGPSLRLDLAKGLGLEFDVLYQRINYDSTSLSSIPEIVSFTESFEAVKANRWQFPLLVQYSRAIRASKVFVEAGPAISTIANSQGTSRTTSINVFFPGTAPTTTTTNSTFSGQASTFAGITAGAGLDLPVFHHHLRPELRYSHWFSPNAASAVSVTGSFSEFLHGTAVSSSIGIAQNEASFLLAFSF